MASISSRQSGSNPVADPTQLSFRAGDTKVYVDDLTDTLTGDAIDEADLTDPDWTATCQIRLNYAVTSPVVAEFNCETTGAAQVTRTLFEDQSLLLDSVPFKDTDTKKLKPRRVYWDAQLRKEDGLAAGEPYVLTYLSGWIDILGQVSRAD
jgi:hypothetical protein